MSFPRNVLGFLLLATVGASLAFQIANLTTTALWHDEAFSALLIQYESYEEMLSRIALDVHPPLYYTILRLWGDIFGVSLFSLRFFSFLFGLLTAAGTFLLAKEIFQNKNIALVSALVLAMGSFQVQYNLEARMYTLGAFFLVLATFFLLRALKTPAPSRRFFLFLAVYAVCAAAALYTHYYTVFGIAGHAMFTLYTLRLQLKKILLVGIGFAAVAVSYLPWLPTFLRQLSQVQESYWIPGISKWSIPTTISKMVTGDGFDPNQAAFVIVGINIIVAAALAFTFWQYRQKSAWILLFVFLAPFAGSILISLQTSIYLDRYFIFYLPFLVIALAAAAFAMRRQQIRFALLALMVGGAAISYPLHWQSWNLAEKPGMSGASAYILSSAKQNETVVANSSFVFFTFRYYNQGRLPHLLYAEEELAHFSGTALLDEQDIVRSFESVGQNGDIVWTIDTTGFGNFQPTVPNSWKQQEEKEFPDAYEHRGSLIVRKYLVQN